MQTGKNYCDLFSLSERSISISDVVPKSVRSTRRLRNLADAESMGVYTAAALTADLPPPVVDSASFLSHQYSHAEAAWLKLSRSAAGVRWAANPERSPSADFFIWIFFG